nr:squamosa promoter-binding-like protein 12 [Tanacetum cinerariifolium]
MDWNLNTPTEWDWENLTMYSKKEIEVPKNLKFSCHESQENVVDESSWVEDNQSFSNMVEDTSVLYSEKMIGLKLGSHASTSSCNINTDTTFKGEESLLGLTKGGGMDICLTNSTLNFSSERFMPRNVNHNGMDATSNSIISTYEIHSLLREGVSADEISLQPSPWASALFEFLPPFIRKQLSQFGPICNGYEILQVRPLLQATNQEDESWTGSPCLPQNWHGVKCNQSNRTVGSICRKISRPTSTEHHYADSSYEIGSTE